MGQPGAAPRSSELVRWGVSSVLGHRRRVDICECWMSERSALRPCPRQRRPRPASGPVPVGGGPARSQPDDPARALAPPAAGRGAHTDTREAAIYLVVSAKSL